MRSKDGERISLSSSQEDSESTPMAELIGLLRRAWQHYDYFDHRDHQNSTALLSPHSPNLSTPLLMQSTGSSVSPALSAVCERDRLSTWGTEKDFATGLSISESVRGQRLRLGLAGSRQSFDFFWRTIPYFYLSFISLADRIHPTVIRQEREDDGSASSFGRSLTSPGWRRTSTGFSGPTLQSAQPRNITLRCDSRGIRTVTPSHRASKFTQRKEQPRIDVVENILLRRMLSLLYLGVNNDSSLSTEPQSGHFHRAYSSTYIDPGSPYAPETCSWCVLSCLLEPDPEHISEKSYAESEDDMLSTDCSMPAYAVSTSMSKALNEISADARRKYYPLNEFIKSSNRHITSLLQAFSFRLFISPLEWSQRLSDLLCKCPDSISRRIIEIIDSGCV